MRRLRTFIHQKRFFQKQDPSISNYSTSSKPANNEDDWTGAIDHRQVEDHRLSWKKRFDRFFYLLAMTMIVYALYQWWMG